ncbi:ABC transporter substrate-binding protein [Limimaricola hongkongensis]|uniref:Putative glutathione transporter,solute-binding component n=1 Tax=Limimaricola hongkongensis DSM 17492 TaxID=1122180 RepID=A0A017H9H7_9RHOB|nr:ABC transporter substrate-binding protein [Limimaricola hongkongensis]EYD70439.1 Putative glutathione transporter,solute-binding component [Limimaricola hongkongensis DSM 17492]
MTFRKTTLLAALLSATALSAQAADFRFALESDPDILDPDQSRTFVGRIVYTSLCDKLVDITPDLEIIPQLATGWSWNEAGTQLTMQLREDAVFHDGTPFDAEAVAANIERSQTMEESRRKSEVASIIGTEVLGSHEIRIDLGQPDATLLAQFADRAGMMVSPTAAAEAGADFGLMPVCSGPYKFEERISQDRIVLSKFADHYDADAYGFDTVTFLPIPDDTVRLANLQSGDVDMINRLAATDLARIEADPEIEVAQAISLGYQGVTFNVGNGEAADNPWGTDARLRRAFELTLDRNAINQVVFEGASAAGNQPFPPNSPWYDSAVPMPERDIEAAKALLAEAGYPDGIALEVQVPNRPVSMQLMQVVQSMAAEAGIDITLNAKEFATMLADQSAGAYVASQVGWSGRVDPDGNIHQFVTTEGGINDSGFSHPEVDAALDAARTSSDIAARKEGYDAARKILNEEAPLVYIYHDTWIWAMADDITGFTPYPDGMLRLAGVTKSE